MNENYTVAFFASCLIGVICMIGCDAAHEKHHDIHQDRKEHRDHFEGPAAAEVEVDVCCECSKCDELGNTCCDDDCEGCDVCKGTGCCEATKCCDDDSSLSEEGCGPGGCTPGVCCSCLDSGSCSCDDCTCADNVDKVAECACTKCGCYPCTNTPEGCNDDNCECKSCSFD